MGRIFSDALQFNNDLFLHDKIEAVAAVEPQTLVRHGQLDLTPEFDSA